MRLNLREFFTKEGNFIVVAIVVTTFLLIGSYFYLKNTSQSIQKAKEDDLQTVAELKIDQIVLWHKERTADSEVLSKSRLFIKGVFDWLKNKNDKLLLKNILESLTTFKNEFGYETIMLTTKEGEILLSLDNKRINDELTFKNIKAASVTRKITFTDFYYCTEEKKIHYDIIIPLIINSENLIAIVVFRVDPNKFLFPLIQKWPTPSKTAETLILRREGDNVLYLNELRHQKNTALQLQIPLSRSNLPAVQALSGKIGIVNGIDYRDNEVLAYVSPIPGTRWFIVAKVNSEEVFAELRVRAYFTAGFTFILILSLVSGLAWIYSRRQRDIYRALYNTQEEFITTLHSIGDAVITTDIKGYVRFLNPVAQLLTGWTFTDAKNKPLEIVFKIINEETRDTVTNPVSKIIKDGLIVGLANHTLLISKNGKEIPIADSGAPIKDKNGNIIGVVLVFRDQTEERLNHKLLNARLELLQYSISHSLSELLTKTLDDVCELTESKIGFYHLVEEDQENLKLQAWSSKTKEEFCKAEGEGLHYKISEAGVWVDCMSEKKAVIHNDYASLPHKKGLPEGHAEVIRECVVPIIVNNKVVAIIGIGNKPNCYVEKDIEIAEYFGTAAWEIAEKKRIDEEYYEAQRKFRSTVNNLKGFVYRCRNDHDWTMEYLSDSIENITGYKVSDFINNKVRSYNSIIHVDDQKKIWENIQKAIVIKEPYVLEYRIITSKNDVRWVWERGRGVFEKDKLIALEGFIDDVTEEKIAIESLQVNELKLRSLVENSINLFYSHDTKHVLHYLSPQVKEILGYEIDEALVKWTDLASDHPINKIGFEKTVKAIETGIAQGTYELELVHKSGSKVWVEVREAPLVENGKTVLIVGSLTDITERKNVEVKLQNSEERLRILTEKTGTIVYDRDLRTNVVHRGGAIEDVLGYSSEEYNQTSVEEFFNLLHLDDRERILLFEEELTKKGGNFNVQYRVKHKNGKYIHIEDCGIGITDNNGKITRVLGSMKDITERKSIEDALFESERKFRQVVEEAKEIIFTINLEGYFTYVNLAGLKTSGYTFEELSKLKYYDFILDEFKRDVQFHYLKQYKSRTENTYKEYPFKTKNNKTVWIGQNANLIVEGDIVKGFYVIGRDITDRKIEEEKRKESEEKLRVMFETSIEGICMTDVNDNMIWVNPRMEQMLGYSQGELVNMNYSKLIPSEQLEDYTKKNVERSKGKSDIYERKLVTKNGMPIWAMISASPIYDKFGNYNGSFGMFTDITEIKAAEEEIRKFYLGVEQSPITIMITDVDGKIEYVNSKFHDLTGYMFKEVFGENPRFLSSGHKTKQEYKELWDTILSGENWVGEFLNKKKNGELFWESATIYPLVNDEGKISHFIAMKEDITERKKMTEELILAKEKALASEKIKSEFLAQMSHEIRTPINIILGNTSYIKEELITDRSNEFADVFDAIEYSSKRIIRTIDLILNMAELQTGAFTPILKEIDLDKEIILPLMQEHHKLAKNKNLVLNYECKIKNTKHFVDEYCALQIFANLIDNAIKYTDKGKIEVSLFNNKSGNKVVEVKDTGIGISKEYMQNLFEPFIQEEHGYSRAFEGNGLGLALVKNYCDLNNAKLEVESAKGIGSTFRVIFQKQIGNKKL